MPIMHLVPTHHQGAKKPDAAYRVPVPEGYVATIPAGHRVSGVTMADDVEVELGPVNVVFRKKDAPKTRATTISANRRKKCKNQTQ